MTCMDRHTIDGEVITNYLTNYIMNNDLDIQIYHVYNIIRNKETLPIYLINYMSCRQ